MKSPRPLPPVPPVAGQTLDAQLHLLDRQVLDSDGVPVTTVDDLELGAPPGAHRSWPLRFPWERRRRCSPRC
jgi:hypothetical protein